MLLQYTEKELIEIYKKRLEEINDCRQALLDASQISGESVSRLAKLLETHKKEVERKEREELKKAKQNNKTKIYLNKCETIKTFGGSKVDGVKKLRVYYMDGRLEEYPFDNENIAMVKEAIIYQAKLFCEDARKISTVVVRDFDREYVKRWKLYLYCFDNVHYVKDKSLLKEINSRLGLKTLQKINTLSKEKHVYGNVFESEETEYFRSMKLCKTIIDDAKIKSKKTK